MTEPITRRALVGGTTAAAAATPLLPGAAAAARTPGKRRRNTVPGRLAWRDGHLVATSASLEVVFHYTGEPRGSFAPYSGSYYTTRDLHPVDEAKGAFVRQIAQARTTFGNRWLAYGRVARPTGTRSPGKVALNFADAGDYVPSQPPATGVWEVPQLIEAAWFDRHDRLGLFFVNLHATEPMTLRVDVDARERWDIDARRKRIVKTSLRGRKVLGRVGRDNHVRFRTTLPPREVVMVALDRRRS